MLKVYVIKFLLLVLLRFAFKIIYGLICTSQRRLIELHLLSLRLLKQKIFDYLQWSIFAPIDLLPAL